MFTYEQPIFPIMHRINLCFFVCFCLILFCYQATLARGGRLRLPPGGGEIELSGGGQAILSGDTVPSALDGTDLGAVLACNGSVSHSFVLTNAGVDTLRFTGISFSGALGNDLSANALPGFLAAGQSHTFTLTYDPSAVGTGQATVVIINDDPDESNFVFRVAGTGLADVTAPVALCHAVTLYLGPTGTATLSPAQLDNGSSDNCGVTSRTLSQTMFNCQNQQPISVSMTVSDAVGNTNVCAAMVTVDDTIPPTARCKSSIVAYTDAQGIYPLNAMMVDSSSYDNCGIPFNSNFLSHPHVSCGSTNPAIYTVTMYVRDNSFNVSTCTTHVYAYDYYPPTIYNCPQDTVYVNSGGPTIYSTCSYLSSWPPEVFEACSGFTCQPASTAFTCNNVGLNNIWTTFLDQWGNASSCNVQVWVFPGGPAIAQCQNATVSLDANGVAAITPAMVDGGSYGPCAATSNFSVSPSTFNCSQLGVQSVVLSVSYSSGGNSSCTASVTVLDQVSPTPTCQPVTVTLGSGGSATLNASAMLQSVADNCGATTQIASQTMFSCADTVGTPVLVTVSDASGNVGTCTSIVTAIPTPLGLNAQAALQSCGYHVSCAGGSDGVANAGGSGGCGPLQYLWSTGATTAQVTGLAAGTYQVTLTDGYQSTSMAVTLTAPPALQVQAIPLAPICFGDSTGSISAVATGGSACQPYLYQWSTGATTPGISNLPAGNYGLTVQDAQGCQASSQASIVTFPASPIAISLIGSTLTATPGFASYQWYNSVGAIPGATAFQFTPGANGLYTVAAVDSNGCAATSAAYAFTLAGTSPIAGGVKGISLHPHPNTGLFQVLLPVTVLEHAEFSVLDLQGRKVYLAKMDVLPSGQAFDLSTLAAGSYFLRVKVADGATYQTRWVKN
jgi:hypothetical protein